MKSGLYAIVDDTVHAEFGLGRLLECIVKESTISVVQLRLKKKMKEQKIKWVNYAIQLKKHRPFFLVINDDLSFLNFSGVDAVHLGQEDLIFADGQVDFKRIGVSTHDLQQALLAQQSGALYIGCGAVFPTASKKNPKELGVEILRDIVRRVSLPTVAIGGIHLENISDVAHTGCTMAAVISALVKNNKFVGQALHEKFQQNSASSLRL